MKVNDPSLGDGVYNIVAEGVGVPPLPEIDLSRTPGVSIPDSGTDAVGSVEIGASLELTYVIGNSGDADLTVDAVSIGSEDNVLAEVSVTPPVIIAPAATFTFTVAYTVAEAGPFDFTISVESDDADESPYTLLVSGEGTNAPDGSGGGPSTGNGSSSASGGGSTATPDSSGCQMGTGGGGAGGWLAALVLAVGLTLRRRRAPRAAWLIASLMLVIGCATGEPEDSTEADEPLSGGGSGGSGGATGGDDTPGGAPGTGGAPDLGPCQEDCSLIDTGDPCLTAVCNDGSLLGPVGVCTVVYDDGASCDDGAFCTVGETCSQGVCGGGQENTCGIVNDGCQAVACDEASATCSTHPVEDGTACVSDQLCLVGTTCQDGLCAGGTLNDCLFAPTSDDCHVATCNPDNGLCEEHIGNEGELCNDPNDLCTVAKTCSAGVCQGGSPKDCSTLTSGCDLGTCDATTGACVTQALMPGDVCDDLDACTMGETCQAGNSCSGGSPVSACSNTADGCCPASCTELDDIDCACPGTFVGSTCVYLASASTSYASDAAARVSCQGLGTGWDLCAPSMLCDSDTLSYLGTEGCNCSGGSATCSCGSASNVYVHVSGGSSPYYVRASEIAGCGAAACTASASESCGVALCCKP